MNLKWSGNQMWLLRGVIVMILKRLWLDLFLLMMDGLLLLLLNTKRFKFIFVWFLKFYVASNFSFIST